MATAVIVHIVNKIRLEQYVFGHNFIICEFAFFQIVYQNAFLVDRECFGCKLITFRVPYGIVAFLEIIQFFYYIVSPYDFIEVTHLDNVSLSDRFFPYVILQITVDYIIKTFGFEFSDFYPIE